MTKMSHNDRNDHFENDRKSPNLGLLFFFISSRVEQLVRIVITLARSWDILNTMFSKFSECFESCSKSTEISVDSTGNQFETFHFWNHVKNLIKQYIELDLNIGRSVSSRDCFFVELLPKSYCLTPNMPYGIEN